MIDVEVEPQSAIGALLTVTDLRVRFPGTAFSLTLDALAVRAGECVGVLGPSGSGKSTLLRAIKGLVPLAAGRVDLDGTARDVALIYQQFHLVGRATVYENILAGSLGRVPAWRAVLGAFPRAERAAAVRSALEVGLGEQLLARADRTSGGQQQRVAIARAIVQRARLVLADEPVASLDPETGRQVLDVLLQAAELHEQGLLISLHDPMLARQYCSRLLGLRDGQVVFDAPASAVTDADLERLYQRPA
jgi:phosphonate transport system ATP-binding protein